MTKPTKKQLNQISKLVAKSWAESCDALSDAELKSLEQGLSTNPDMILETQKRLAAAAFVCFKHGAVDFSNALKNAGMILSAFKIKAERTKQ